jgi:hypothetical protein
MSNRDLVNELSDNLGLLMKRQVALAKYEAEAELRRGKTLAELAGVAGGAALSGIVILFSALALSIGGALGGQYWLGALIVGGTLLIAAGVFGGLAWAQRPRRTFSRTRRELEKEVSWARRRRT